MPKLDQSTKEDDYEQNVFVASLKKFSEQMNVKRISKMQEIQTSTCPSKRQCLTVKAEVEDALKWMGHETHTRSILFSVTIDEAMIN